MVDRDTLALYGFQIGADGAARAPDADWALYPIGAFIQLTITLPSGERLEAVMSRAALKIRETVSP
jgi:hypothetical protein